MASRRNKIFVVGYFGYRTNQLDGQTIKSRNIYRMIQAKLGDTHQIRQYDTQEPRFRKMSFFGFLKNTMTCGTFVIIPCRNNLTYVFPFVYLLSLVFRFRILHVAVGSGQTDYFRRHPVIRWMNKRIKAIFPQVSIVDKELKEEFGFRNSHLLNNFRINDYVPALTGSSGDTLRIVFMSRIQKKKGLDVVFALADHIRRTYPHGTAVIDFYGGVEPDDAEYFQAEVARYDFVEYRGKLEPEHIYTTLNGYDLLILPTYYNEGFPGAILDAYISGIPVLVSRWQHTEEFVEEGVTGYICPMGDKECFCRKVDLLIGDKTKLPGLKKAAWERSKRYGMEYAWSVFRRQMDLE